MNGSRGVIQGGLVQMCLLRAGWAVDSSPSAQDRLVVRRAQTDSSLVGSRMLFDVIAEPYPEMSRAGDGE